MVTLERVGVLGAMAMHKINIKLPSAGLALTLAEASTCVYPVSCSQIETTTTANKAHTHTEKDRVQVSREGVGSGNALKVKSKNKSIYVKHFCYKGY